MSPVGPQVEGKCVGCSIFREQVPSRPHRTDFLDKLWATSFLGRGRVWVPQVNIFTRGLQTFPATLTQVSSSSLIALKAIYHLPALPKFTYLSTDLSRKVQTHIQRPVRQLHLDDE